MVFKTKAILAMANERNSVRKLLTKLGKTSKMQKVL